MRTKAILCAAVVCSLVAAGCSKSEKKPGEDKLAKPPTGGGGPSEARAVAWGGAVKGLQAGLEIRGRRFEEGAPIEVTIHARNTGEMGLKLFDGGRDSRWRIVFIAKDFATARRAGRFNTWARESRRASYLDLAKSAEKVAVRCSIAGAEWQFADARADDYEAVKRTSTATLPPGRYMVAAVYENIAVERPWPEGTWLGTVTSSAVEIEIAPKGGAGTAPARGAPAAGLGPISDEERARLVKGAEAVCKLADAPTAGRRVTVVGDGKEATVTFHLPERMRGGDFVIKIDRTTGDVIDVKLWR